jgi:hypothetical protein
MMGKKALHSPCASQACTISTVDVSTIQRGMYNCKVSLQDGTVFTKTIELR